MTQNDPESTSITFFGQNQAKPAFSAKIGQNHFFRPKSIKTSDFGQKTTFSGQNQPKVFLAKIGRLRGFRSKSTRTTFFQPEIDQNQSFQSKPVFLVKINQNHFARPKLTKTSFCGPNALFPAKTDKDQSVFSAKTNQNHFNWQIYFLLRFPKMCFPRKRSDFRENCSFSPLGPPSGGAH